MSWESFGAEVHCGRAKRVLGGAGERGLRCGLMPVIGGGLPQPRVSRIPEMDGAIEKRRKDEKKVQ